MGKEPADKRLRHAVQSLMVVAAAVGGLGWALGGAGIFFGGIVAMLWLAWRFDNSAGTCLVLAIQVAIACAILLVLVAMMALVH